MSDWNGPALYRIESSIMRNARVALSGGNATNGTKVHITLADEYRITTVIDSKKILNVNGGKTDDGTKVWLYNDGQHESCRWYLGLYDNSTLKWPDIGKGN